MKMFILSILLFGVYFSHAQNTYLLVRQGNHLASQKKFTDAEVLYRKALEKDKKLPTAYYNTGNTQYLQNQYDIAIKQYEESLVHFENKEDKAHAYHNIGNAYLAQEKYQESIEAYKNALKLNPSDMDTKYNLAYAQAKLKKEQSQENQQNQNQQNQQKEEKEQEQKEQNQEGKPEDKEQEQEKPKPKEGNLTKEEAEKILNALQKQEAKLQEKLDKPEGEPAQIIIEKDW